MSKDLNVTRLCDAYGALLTPHRLEIIRNYYDDDLSLAEIAENFGITRQAALCSIKQAEKQLFEYEAKLRLVERADRLEFGLLTALEQLDGDVAKAKDTLNGLLSDLRQ